MGHKRGTKTTCRLDDSQEIKWASLNEEIKFVQMKGHAFYQGEINRKYRNKNALTKSFPEPLGQFQPNFAQSPLGEGD